jgi:hypothetical protein
VSPPSRLSTGSRPRSGRSSPTAVLAPRARSARRSTAACRTGGSRGASAAAFSTSPTCCSAWPPSGPGCGSPTTAPPWWPALAGHAAARAELVRRFLGAYAPAPARAFAEWCGLGPAEAEASIAAVAAGDEIVEVRLDGRRALALAADLLHLEHPPAVTGVRLVPAGDPFLNQRDRATLLPDPEHRRQLWRPAGAPGLVLVDGVPAGIWRQRRDKDRPVFTVELWRGPPDPELASALDEEAGLLLR